MKLEFVDKLSSNLILFFLFVSVYALTMAGSIQYGDEVEKYRVAQSIVERQDVSFRPTAQRNQAGVGGRTYSTYELGQTLVEIPFYLLGKLAYRIAPTADVNQATQLAVGFLNPLVTALTVVVLYRTCLQLGYAASAWPLAMVFGLSTIAWPYSKGFTREPLLTLLLLFTFYSVVCFRRTGQNRWLLAAGMASGYLAFTKFIHAVVIPVFVVYLVVEMIRSSRARVRHPRWREMVVPALRVLLVFALPALILLAVQSLYALVRYGTPTAGVAGTREAPVEWVLFLLRSAHPDQAIPGLVISLEKGILVYSPPAVLFFWAWVRWYRRQASHAWLALALILVEFATVIGRPDWDGGSWWGPRYLVQITPLLLLPLAAWLDTARSHRGERAVFLTLAALGVVVQLIGVLGNARDVMDITGTTTDLVKQADFLLHGALDSLTLSLSPHSGWVQITPYGLVLVAVVGVMGLLAVRRGTSDEPDRHGTVRWNLAVGAAIALVQAAACLLWLVAPYTDVQAAQGDTHWVAGERFLADGRAPLAAAMYALALADGTHASREALARLDQLLPLGDGESFVADDLTANTVGREIALIEPDSTTSLAAGGTSLRISIPGDQEGTASALSDWIAVEPDTRYAISGWIKTLNVYGSGSAVVAVSEDNGNWKGQRTLDVSRKDETGGWSRFRNAITTLPTTHRLSISVGLWQTAGTVWVENIQLTKVTQ